MLEAVIVLLKEMRVFILALPVPTIPPTLLVEALKEEIMLFFDSQFESETSEVPTIAPMIEVLMLKDKNIPLNVLQFVNVPVCIFPVIPPISELIGFPFTEISSWME